MHRLNFLTQNFSAPTQTVSSVQICDDVTLEKKNDTHAFLKSYYNNLSDDSPYISTIKEKLVQAKTYAQKRLSEKKAGEQFAVTLDIDDTSISHYPNFLAENFENSPLQIDQRIRKSDNPAIIPILDYYQWLNENKIAVFFISYRISHVSNPDKDLYPYTLLNLQKAGYQFTEVSHIYLPTNQDVTLKSDVFKSKTRKDITDKGYKIITNIGDQLSDLGENAELNILLPNKLYGPDSVLGLKPIVDPVKNTQSGRENLKIDNNVETEKLKIHGLFKQAINNPSANVESPKKLLNVSIS